MPGKDIIVIGASSGGIDALRAILAALPAEFGASLFVVIHTAPDSPAVLADILGSAGPLPAMYARAGEPIMRGRVYIAPTDRHLLLAPGKVELTRGPKENRFRPAIDPLFRSAAQVYGPRVVGVILTGGLDDGVNGLATIKRLGGTTVVQEPAEAVAPSMPLNALRQVPIDHRVRIAQLAPLLVRLAATPADMPEGERAVPEGVNIEVGIARGRNTSPGAVMALGEPSMYTCPECHGVLLEMKDRTPLRFRCHTGHAYALESLLAEMDRMIDESLWSAIRALEERAILLRQAASDPLEAHGNGEKLLEAAAETMRRADTIRQTLFEQAREKTGSED